MTEQQSAVVIGGGIVGVSAAIWLRREGVNVTVIDRATPGDRSATSFGNAGVLAACSVAPVTYPGMIPKAPKLLFDPEFPLFLRWSHLPKLTPWLLKYLSHANDKDTRRIARGLTGITHDTVDQHEALTKGTDAAEWTTNSDYTFVYKDRAGFEADGYTWELRREAGFVPEIIEGDAVHEFEPMLAKNLNCLALMRDHGYVRDPGGYVAALAKEAQKLGAVFRQGEVKDVTLTDGKVTAVVTDQGDVPCDKVVLATGSWSKALTDKLGLKVPIESERGYHIMFKNPSQMPKIPMMMSMGKFVATPMQDGLRCAGTVEFGGLNEKMSDGPLKFLRRKVKEYFPDLEYSEEVPWLGHRPATSDSLPLIGEIKNTGVFAGFGHHHIGLTAGPKTARIIAGLITGKKDNIDLSIYDPGRF
ncbi:NAD(P)/FAD-dependent oxidoreductase [Halocynthiibacter namhaensis]|uniref:NAD(P)/FAD-dependent oxidoreductase n=1 Tax=Halocynthiibacter namhaensis TaxID=1290553 RepID=UPI000578F795|nr:FAD-dependent oxidoreductase [Halocynthiibacter namhaensis]